MGYLHRVIMVFHGQGGGFETWVMTQKKKTALQLKRNEQTV